MSDIYYAGDSTATFNKIDTYPQTGMSQALYRYVKDNVFVRSFARNGRSTKSFIDEGLLDGIAKSIRKGDFLIIQFGHNDNKPDPLRHTDPYTSYTENMRTMINVARNAGAYPILVTPIARRLFDKDGNFLPGSHGEYPDAVRKLGAAEQVPVIDMTTITENYVARLGDELSRPLYVWPVDNTHLKPEGAVTYVGFLCAEIEKLGSPYKDLFVSRIAQAENIGLDVS